MLDSTDKILTFRVMNIDLKKNGSEAKLVSNTLNPEKMEDKNNSEKNSERSNTIVNSLNNSDRKISLEELINEFDLSATIKSLYQELKKAKETALSMAEEGMDVKMIARLVKVSEKDVQKWIDETLCVTK